MRLRRRSGARVVSGETLELDEQRRRDDPRARRADQTLALDRLEPSRAQWQALGRQPKERRASAPRRTKGGCKGRSGDSSRKSVSMTIHWIISMTEKTKLQNLV